MATVLIGGGSGLLGKRLSRQLQEHGYEVLHLSRSPRPDAPFRTYQWDVEGGTIDPEAVRKADWVINLAGAGIADWLWTSKRKRLIIDSRVDSTRLLLRAFQETGHRPRAFISSAAIGYYGDRGEDLLTETDGPGRGFLSESCFAWEEAIGEVASAGIRAVALRLGIVLSSKGGALPKMMLSLPVGIAPYFGDGRQWYSWLHIDDAAGAFLHALGNENMSGVYNVAGPNPARNRDLIKTLVQATGKPALLAPVPAFALRLALGEMSHTVLDSTRVSSEKLEQTGFRSRFPELLPALQDVLARKV